jgi:hypothetical protein
MKTAQEQQARNLWNTILKIGRAAKELGYHAHTSNSYGCWYEVTFRAIDADGSVDKSDANYLGVARTQDLSPITFTSRVPQDIRDAVAPLLAA